MKFIGLLLVFCGIWGSSIAQTANTTNKPDPKPIPLKLGKNDTIQVYMTVDSGKLMPWVVTPDVNITDVRIFKSQADLDNYRRLRYNVLKVLPYARFAGERYRKLQRELAVEPDKHKQKILVDRNKKSIQQRDQGNDN
jgi:hypothetical protein